MKTATHWSLTANFDFIYQYDDGILYDANIWAYKCRDYIININILLINAGRVYTQICI